MSTNKTEHLNLHQWESTDRFHREEFNENFAKIDAETAAIREELAAHTVPKVGTYTGNGGTTAINLGFRPRAVMIAGGMSATVCTGSQHGVTLTATGFQAAPSGQNISLVNSGTVYHYVAL